MVMGRSVLAFGVFLSCCDGCFNILANSGLSINRVVCHGRRRDAKALSHRHSVGCGGLCASLCDRLSNLGFLPLQYRQRRGFKTEDDPVYPVAKRPVWGILIPPLPAIPRQRTFQTL